MHLFHNPLYDFDRARRSGHDAGAQRGQFETRKIGMFQLSDEHRRDAVDSGTALFGDGTKCRFGIKGSSRNNHSRSAYYASHIGHHHSEAVIKRYRNAEAIKMRKVHRVSYEQSVVDDVVVRESGTFR